MRILHILDHSLPQHSGYVFRTLSIVRTQRELGLDPILMTTPRHPNAKAGMETIDGWDIHRTGIRDASLRHIPVLREIGEMTATRAALRALAGRLKPDILHAHSPSLNAIPALLSGLGLPVVYEIRAFWEDAAVDHGTIRENGVRYRTVRAMETWAARRADAVTAICAGLRGDLIARGIPEDKLTLIPNAVDIEQFKPIETADETLKAELGLKGRTVLGFVGSFYAYEGLDFVIGTLPALLRKHPDLALLLVGGGPEEERLKRQAEALGVAHRVIFTGRVPHADVPRYYSVIDILVYARHKMRLTDLVTPLKPLEAMAQKKLMIASDVGGHKELIEDGRGGRLFKADDTEDMIRVLGEALEQKADWPEWRETGRRFVEQERTWRASAARYLPLYERLKGRTTSIR